MNSLKDKLEELLNSIKKEKKIIIVYNLTFDGFISSIIFEQILKFLKIKEYLLIPYIYYNKFIKNYELFIFLDLPVNYFLLDNEKNFWIISHEKIKNIEFTSNIINPWLENIKTVNTSTIIFEVGKYLNKEFFESRKWFVDSTLFREYYFENLDINNFDLYKKLSDFYTSYVFLNSFDDSLYSIYKLSFIYNDPKTVLNSVLLKNNYIKMRNYIEEEINIFYKRKKEVKNIVFYETSKLPANLFFLVLELIENKNKLYTIVDRKHRCVIRSFKEYPELEEIVNIFGGTLYNYRYADVIYHRELFKEIENILSQTTLDKYF